MNAGTRSSSGRVLLGPSPVFADVCAHCGKTYGVHNGSRCPTAFESHFEALPPAADDTGSEA